MMPHVEDVVLRFSAEVDNGEKKQNVLAKLGALFERFLASVESGMSRHHANKETGIG